tara:strand:+ start:4309 stop:5151 length:843 start_codon:yes stop_codon:yes gene_type:complete
MKNTLLLFIFPFIVIGQEFYPGSLSNTNEPICYQTSTTLGFDFLPSAPLDLVNFTWQKSWNGENWFTIEEVSGTTYTTDTLFTDTYYRVNVNYKEIVVSTNEIIVNVLPPLNPGVLASNGSMLNLASDSLCINGPDLLEFLIGASGAEWSWGGFLEFSYQWQKNNNFSIVLATDGNEPIIQIEDDGWVDVGDDTNTHNPLDLGSSIFRCAISSPYGCGTVLTEPLMVEVVDCFNLSVIENSTNSKLILTTNILGQESIKHNLSIYIYEDGSVEKKFFMNQ